MSTSTEPASSTAPATDPAQSTQFTAFWLYKRKETWDEIAGDQWNEAVAQFTSLLNELPDNVVLRGSYTALGLTPDVEFFLWAHAPKLDQLQRLAIAIDRTTIGRYMTLQKVYFGSAGMSQYDPAHSPAFILGKPAKRYLSVYPFIKTPDWYLIPYQERRRLMVEHGEMGREYPGVLTNTVNSFGLADQEFIVALEEDDPKTLSEMVQKLRAAEVRKWTALDTPIYLGDRKPIGEVLSDLRGRA
ncbi:MAG TPA: chlorite dismutase family protein [Thermomicrobiales bacterium]|nr:chlorite dismutase family protein [Thermomicrobiales bacterium]